MRTAENFDAAAAATRRFLETLPPTRSIRVAAAAASAEGMGLLCAVEAVFREGLPSGTKQELVWLAASPQAGVHRLRLAAYAGDNRLLAEAAHEFAS